MASRTALVMPAKSAPSPNAVGMPRAASRDPSSARLRKVQRGIRTATSVTGLSCPSARAIPPLSNQVAWPAASVARVSTMVIANSRPA
jgi:hypothetical protein